MPGGCLSATLRKVQKENALAALLLIIAKMLACLTNKKIGYKNTRILYKWIEDPCFYTGKLVKVKSG